MGATGCKAVVFSEKGETLSSVYEEYDYSRPAPGQAELDSAAVWNKIKGTIAQASDGSPMDPIQALSVCSLGEALVPVSRDRRILGSSILGFDVRGGGFLERLDTFRDNDRLYRINGNSLGNIYTVRQVDHPSLDPGNPGTFGIIPDDAAVGRPGFGRDLRTLGVDVELSVGVENTSDQNERATGPAAIAGRLKT